MMPRARSQLASPFDATAPSFERHRALPEGVAQAIRGAVIAALSTPSPPRLLEIGAGTGRIGRAFVEAGDDYCGVDLSSRMLDEFRRRAGNVVAMPRLVQADGQRLPFNDAMFDAIMLMQVFGGAKNWRGLLREAGRVLRPTGYLVLGRTVVPTDGVDAEMKQRLDVLLRDIGVRSEAKSVRQYAERFLTSVATRVECRVAATWTSERTARMFLERQWTGAYFSVLPEPVKERALKALAEWAIAAFGSLDGVRSEQYAFELQLFTLSGRARS